MLQEYSTFRRVCSADDEDFSELALSDWYFIGLSHEKFH